MPKTRRPTQSERELETAAHPLVLVVDDVLQARELFARVLSRHNISCVTVGSAAQALQVLQTRPVAVLLTDLVMPEISGLDLIRSVKLSYPKVRRILVTGSEYNLTTGEIAELDGNVLLKPVDAYALAIKVMSELERYRVAGLGPKTNGHG